MKTRNGADATRWSPEIVRAMATLDGKQILDGEICVLDDIGRSDFDRLQHRARARRFRPGADAVAFIAFDQLVADARGVTAESFYRRKERLKLLLAAPPGGLLALDFLHGDGVNLFNHALALELEGIVARRLDSPYVVGTRSPNWVKIKRKGAVPPGRFQRNWTSDLRGDPSIQRNGFG